jgi:N-acetylmuramic acid 6-phosphate etherase
VAQQAVKIALLRERCIHAVEQGGRIILVGCGASGRIAAQIEHDWRLVKADPNALISVLAGGEVALIEAVEASEDSPEYAVAQLQAVELSAKDQVIALSAGGESPFILGALRYAQSVTQAPPWFIYCNADVLLLKRNAQHLVGEQGFERLSLDVGPMALTGSTRMQATTAMTYALMQALFLTEFNAQRWRDFYHHLDWSPFIALTQWEAERARQDQKVVYVLPAALAMPVLADMTERSPTFNLPGFVNQLALLDVPIGQSAAWNALLLRAPKSASPRLHDFDLSLAALHHLQKTNSTVQTLHITQAGASLQFAFERQQIKLDLGALNILEVQFLLRLILVNHSTLMMGGLGYYHGNLMTNLKPSNAKLVDRAIRYVLFLHEQETGRQLSYACVAEALAEILPKLKPRESIVFRLLAKFKNERCL